MNHVEVSTSHQVERGSTDCKVYHDFNAPSISSLQTWIHQNMAENVTISYNDVDLAQKIFQAGVTTCKGKSTSQKPHVVSNADLVEIPYGLQHNGSNVELSIGVGYINDQSFYTRLIVQLN